MRCEGGRQGGGAAGPAGRVRPQGATQPVCGWGPQPHVLTCARARATLAQSLQEQLSRLQADHAALGQRLAQERQRAADDTAAHRRALEGQAASLDAALRAAAASFTGALQQEFNRADARRAAGADGSGA